MAVDIPLDALTEMKARGASNAALAAHFSCSEKTIDRRLKMIGSLLPARMAAETHEVRRVIATVNDVADHLSYAGLMAREVCEELEQAGDPLGKMKASKNLAEVMEHILKLHDRLMTWRATQEFQEDVLEAIREETEDVAERIFARIERRRAARQLLTPG